MLWAPGTLVLHQEVLEWWLQEHLPVEEDHPQEWWWLVLASEGRGQWSLS